MSYRVRKGDNVAVLSGREKGSTGKVIFVDPDNDTVKVENVNMVTRAQKAKNAQESGGFKKMEGNLHISNVQVICPSCDKATRLGSAVIDGKKQRVCKKCGAILEVKAEKVKKGKKDKKEEKEAKKTDSRVKRTRKTKSDDAKQAE